MKNFLNEFCIRFKLAIRLDIITILMLSLIVLWPVLVLVCSYEFLERLQCVVLDELEDIEKGFEKLDK